MRIPYVSDPPPFTSDADRAIVERIQARRAPRPLTSLDRALLHSPPVADGWNSFLGAIRSRTTSLSASLRESAICRVAALNRAWYEWEHHAPLLLAERRKTASADANASASEDALLTAIFSAPLNSWLSPSNSGNASAAPDEQHALVLAYTDAITVTAQVDADITSRLAQALGERGVVEVAAVVGAYNCVSRFLNGLNVGEREGEEGLKVALETVGGVREGARPVER